MIVKEKVTCYKVTETTYVIKGEKIGDGPGPMYVCNADKTFDTREEAEKFLYDWEKKYGTDDSFAPWWPRRKTIIERVRTYFEEGA